MIIGKDVEKVIVAYRGIYPEELRKTTKPSR
jgi:hypothetical protein